MRIVLCKVKLCKHYCSFIEHLFALHLSFAAWLLSYKSKYFLSSTKRQRCVLFNEISVVDKQKLLTLLHYGSLQQ